jgi:RNA polymerase sigma-70 factor (family 1)
MRKRGFNEEDILLSLSEGDEFAFQSIYERYSPSIYKIAFRYLQSSDLAKDVVQEVFLTVWHSRSSFTQIRNLESYLMTMASHQSMKELKKILSESNYQKNYSEDCLTMVNDSDFLVRNNECNERIAKAVEILPPMQKKAFLLSRVEYQTHEEIAREMNISSGTVKNHIVRALQQLRLKLTMQGLLL